VGQTVLSDRKTGTNLEVRDKLALLERHPLFRGFGAEERHRLASYATTKHLGRGKSLFSKGDAGGALFAVCSGTVEMVVPSAEG
jgi:CRP/FNR family cyclic AMP-dependent transcriptional regulator